MTPFERMNPEEIHAQRRQRIARGSGTSLNDVNELLKSFKLMRKQMNRSSTPRRLAWPVRSAASE